MSTSTDRVGADGYVQTERGFRFKIDPVDRNLIVIVRPRIRMTALVFSAAVLAISAAMIVFSINAIIRGEWRLLETRIVIIGWSALIPIAVCGAVWIASSAIRARERIELAGDRLIVESRILGPARVQSFRLNAVANLRIGSPVVVAMPADESGKVLEARQGLAFDLGERYVRFARALQDSEADALLRLFNSVRPELVDEHERSRLSTRPAGGRGEG